MLPDLYFSGSAQFSPKFISLQYFSPLEARGQTSLEFRNEHETLPAVRRYDSLNVKP